jgi:hypothetical protein
MRPYTGTKVEVAGLRQERIIRPHLADKIEAVPTRTMPIAMPMPDDFGPDELRLLAGGIARLESIDHLDWARAVRQGIVPWPDIESHGCAGLIDGAKRAPASAVTIPDQHCPDRQAQQGAPPNIDDQDQDAGRRQAQDHSHTPVKTLRPQSLAHDTEK